MSREAVDRPMNPMDPGERRRASAFLWLMAGIHGGQRPDLFRGAQAAYRGQVGPDDCPERDDSEFCQGVREYRRRTGGGLA